MAISRSQLAKELEPGLNALFGLEYDKYDKEHLDIFDVESSARAFEEGNISAVEEYVMRDVEITHKLFDKLKRYLI